MKRFLIPVCVLILSIQLFAENENKQGVFEYVIESAQGDFDEIIETLKEKIKVSEWQFLATRSMGRSGCSFRVRVLTLYHPQYAEELFKVNSKTAPFAVIDRIAVFEDENGIHVSIINTRSVTRTVMMDDSSLETISESHVSALRKLILNVVQGTESHKQYGQMREKGFIGKTMGVMAGGIFSGKVKDEIIIANQTLDQVAARVKLGLDLTGKKWGMRLIYDVSFADHQTIILGSSGVVMESKSFDIVKAGSDKSRKSLDCPGLAHAAAYPVEIVLVAEGENIIIRMVDTMFRMKMFFEDAGKMAFMKNMGMPGSIHDELYNQISSNLNP